jgi:hypothetical protein
MIKENETGGASGMNGGDEKFIGNCSWDSVNKRDHMGHLGTGGKTM